MTALLNRITSAAAKVEKSEQAIVANKRRVDGVSKRIMEKTPSRDGNVRRLQISTTMGGGSHMAILIQFRVRNLRQARPPSTLPGDLVQFGGHPNLVVFRRDGEAAHFLKTLC